MVVRHREFIHDYEAMNPGKREQALRDQISAITKRPVTPGKFCATLGTNVAASNKRASTTSFKRLKARVTLAKVWEE